MRRVKIIRPKQPRLKSKRAGDFAVLVIPEERMNALIAKITEQADIPARTISRMLRGSLRKTNDEYVSVSHQAKVRLHVNRSITRSSSVSLSSLTMPKRRSEIDLADFKIQVGKLGGQTVISLEDPEENDDWTFGTGPGRKQDV